MLAPMSTQQIDPTAAEAFAGRMLGVMNDAMLALAVSVGHQTGLYETMAGMAPATSAEIAAAAGLSERHVREWLATQVTGGVVDFDPEAHTYVLPPERAACLTAAAGPGNLAVLAPFTGAFGELEPDLVRGFRDGGGIPVGRMAPRVQPLQARLSGPIHDAALVDVVLPLADGLVERLRSGMDVLDLGCGHGHATTLVADAFPASRVTGIDASAGAIAAARAEAERLAIGNLRFEERDAYDLPDGAYDLVLALDVVHDLAHPAAAIATIHRALRAGGVLVMLEHRLSDRLEENLGHPLLPALYVVSLFHCMALGLEHGGEGVGLAWGERRARAALEAAGFGAIDVAEIPGDPMNHCIVAHKG
jgi:SAM-dependent methyltransferase